MSALVASIKSHIPDSKVLKSSQADKDYVAQFSNIGDQNRVMSPQEIADKSPNEKKLGKSSKTLSLSDFELVKTLGTGTFARVWMVKLANPKEEDREKVFALKVLRKSEVVRLKQVDHVNQERSILADVAGHPFITTLITTFSDTDSLYMVLDYCPGGEIFSYLRKARKFSENASRFYIAELVLILEFLHETEGVAYRDLKPENILLDKEGHVKLVDFGFAKRVHDRETYTLCGTPEYLAPEVIQSLGHTMAVDWWALGILLYELITGYPPFWHQQPMEIYKQILNNPITFPPASPRSGPSYPLISAPNAASTTSGPHSSSSNSSLSSQASSNSTNSTFVSPAAQSLILQLCTVDRHQRLGNIQGGASRVKEHEFFDGVNWDQIYGRKYRGPILPPVRYPGDTQCFEKYPDEKKKKGEGWDRDMGKKWDSCFEDF